METLNPISPALAPIAVLGDYLMYKDKIINLSCVSCYNESEEIIKEWEIHNEGEAVRDFFNRKVGRKTPKAKLEKLCSTLELETLYDTLLQNEDAQVRALVALSGERTAQSIQDSDALVRRYAIKGFFGKAFAEAKLKGCEYDIEYDEDGVLVELLKDSDPKVRAELATHPTQNYKTVLCTDDSDYVRTFVVQHCDSEIGILQLLAKDKCDKVRLAVAMNHATPYRVGAKLVKDKNPRIRRAIIKTHPAYAMRNKQLAQDEDVDVRCELARRGIFLNTLLEDENSEVVSIAKKYLAEKGTEEATPW